MSQSFMGRDSQSRSRLAHLEYFVTCLGFSPDKVASFMADDTDTVCKQLALKSIGINVDRLRQNFSNTDIDAKSIKMWLESNLTDSPTPEKPL